MEAKILTVSNWNSKKATLEMKKSYQSLFQEVSFHMLVEEAHALIDELKNSSLEEALLIRGRALLEEFERRLGANSVHAASLAKMQKKIGERLEKISLSI